MVGEVRSGQVALGCQSACQSTWQAEQPALHALYLRGAWNALATRVMQIDYTQDLAYYYLGRAAEGLGANEAALKYYRKAADLAAMPGFQCRFAGGCEGVDLPRDAYSRLRLVEVAIARRHAQTGPKCLCSPGKASQAKSASGIAAAAVATDSGGATPVTTPASAAPPASQPAEEEWIHAPPVTR
jgi:tetratricopeptide (TPR) repeat protein